MKTLILLSLFFKAFSLTKDYVTNCLVGFEDIDILSAVECGKYSPGNGYCCLLSYDNKKKEVNVYIPHTPETYRKKDNKTKIRSLGEPKKYCYGVSNKGYYEIDNLIKEITSETGMQEVKIDCGGQSLKYGFLKEIILLIIFIIL